MLDEAKKYVNATVMQLFHTSNLVHDLYYQYGFDEVLGNFQQHNFGCGGEENDAVIVNAQDGSRYNNASFMTLPDGQNGHCRMYVELCACMKEWYGDKWFDISVNMHSCGLSVRMWLQLQVCLFFPLPISHSQQIRLP